MKKKKKQKEMNPFLAVLIYFLIATLFFIISFPLFKRTIESKHWISVNADISNYKKIAYGKNAGPSGNSREAHYYKYDILYKYNGDTFIYKDVISDKRANRKITILVNPRDPKDIMSMEDNHLLQYILGIIIILLLISGILQFIFAIKSRHTK